MFPTFQASTLLSFHTCGPQIPRFFNKGGMARCQPTLPAARQVRPQGYKLMLSARRDSPIKVPLLPSAKYKKAFQNTHEQTAEAGARARRSGLPAAAQSPPRRAPRVPTGRAPVPCARRRVQPLRPAQAGPAHCQGAGIWIV